MRIVSQPGIYQGLDLPYEKIGISLNKQDPTKICAFSLSDSNLSWVLARYPTKERTEEVLNNLRSKYFANKDCRFTFPEY